MSNMTHSTSNDVTAKIEASQKNGVYGVFAKSAISNGERILFIEGISTEIPSKYSIQVDLGLHLEPETTDLTNLTSLKSIWRFLNHSSTPNTRVNGVYLEALNTIKVGDEITFNYNANEYDMATPFTCRETGILISGFKNLSTSQQNELKDQLSEHLLPLLES
jgi:hypothetical protein